MAKYKINCTEMSGTGISGKMGDVVDVNGENPNIKLLIKTGWLIPVEDDKPKKSAKEDKKSSEEDKK